MAVERTSCFAVGDRIVDFDEGCVIGPTGRVNVPPKALHILSLLISRSPRLVGKRDLLDSVWPDEAVADAALTQRVKELRRLLGDDARSPRFIETVSRRGYRLIAEVKPLAGGEPVGDHGAAGAPAPSLELPARSGISRPAVWPWVVAVGGVALAATVAVTSWRSSPAGRSSGSPSPPRRVVAIAGFHSLAPDATTEWLSAALTEMTRIELTLGGGVRLVPGEQVATALADRGLERAARTTPEMLAWLRERLGVELVVAGSYLATGEEQGSQIRADVVVLDTGGGAALATLTETAAAGGVLDLVGRLGGSLRDVLGVGAIGVDRSGEREAAVPGNPEALRCYAEAVVQMRIFAFNAARDLLECATAADPGFAAAHHVLAGVWASLGNQSRARESARRALELSAGLPRQHQLFIEADYREYCGEWERVRKLNAALHEFYPDDLEYGLSFANACSRNGDVEAAYAVLAELRKLPGRQGEDPRIDLMEAWATEDDPRRVLTAANRAADKAERIGARFLLASARYQQGRAWEELGRPDLARQAFQEAWKIRHAGGDHRAAANALARVASLLRRQGRLTEARAVLSEALEQVRRVGASDSEPAILVALSEVLLELGERQTARSRAGEALALAEELSNERQAAAARAALRGATNGGVP